MKNHWLLCGILALTPALATAEDIHPAIGIIDSTIVKLRTECGTADSSHDCISQVVSQMSVQIGNAAKATPPTEAHNEQIVNATDRLVAAITSIKKNERAPKTTTPLKTTKPWPATMTDAEVKAHPACLLLLQASAEINECETRNCMRQVRRDVMPKLKQYGEPPKAYQKRFVPLCGIEKMQEKMRSTNR